MICPIPSPRMSSRRVRRKHHRRRVVEDAQGTAEVGAQARIYRHGLEVLEWADLTARLEDDEAAVARAVDELVEQYHTIYDRRTWLKAMKAALRAALPPANGGGG